MHKSPPNIIKFYQITNPAAWNIAKNFKKPVGRYSKSPIFAAPKKPFRKLLGSSDG
ncbi:MAG: hypothetical protein K0Q66_229 [Chitinophagaceae bacterium]|jgi:hypothetical protein|nr:hypothetical protein [Chitinophagaceae bacterium]